MPVIYRCKSCGFVLHVFDHVGQDFYGVPSPSEIASWYGGVCPRCGHRLSAPTLSDVSIRFKEHVPVLAVARRHEVMAGELGAPSTTGIEAPASQAEAGTP